MSTDWESSKGRINSGEIATMVLGSWAVQQFKDAGPNPQDISYMPFPITVDGKRYAGTGGNYSYAINAQNSVDNQIAAMLYVNHAVRQVAAGREPHLRGRGLHPRPQGRRDA